MAFRDRRKVISSNVFVDVKGIRRFIPPPSKVKSVKVPTPKPETSVKRGRPPKVNYAAIIDMISKRPHASPLQLVGLMRRVGEIINVRKATNARSMFKKNHPDLPNLRGRNKRKIK
ncbi:MAG: hypothetical protein NUV57_05305 [archaeon]|nr:hypothetical protein [archaeon]